MCSVSVRVEGDVPEVHHTTFGHASGESIRADWFDAHGWYIPSVHVLGPSAKWYGNIDRLVQVDLHGAIVEFDFCDHSVKRSEADLSATNFPFLVVRIVSASISKYPSFSF